VAYAINNEQLPDLEQLDVTQNSVLDTRKLIKGGTKIDLQKGSIGPRRFNYTFSKFGS